MRPARRIDQLPGNAQPVTALAHTAFEYVAHAQLLADALGIHRLALVGEARVARDDEQPADARQRGDDVLHHAIGEIVLFRVPAQVVERQHGNGRLFREDKHDWWRFLRIDGGGFVDAWSIGLARLPRPAGPDFANEAVTLAGDRANEALLLSAIADRLANRVDMAGDGRFRDDPAAPHCLEQVILADDSIAVADQMQ
ncbi:hypothetical protein D9M72_476870 [compost metagenome]